MSKTTSEEQLALAQAAEWFAALQDESVTEKTKKQWQQWLNASTTHDWAWQQVENIDQRFRDVPAEEGHQALDAAGRSRRRSLLGLAGLAIASSLAWMGWQAWSLRGMKLVTAVGEIRQEILPDGGQLWLNTDTAVRVNYQQDRRLVRLLRGEILIVTAADPRPFVVQTDYGSVFAIGTRFTVRQSSQFATASVSEGRVKVLPNSGVEVEVAAQQSLRFDQDQTFGIEAVSLNDDAWLRGILVADDIPLGEFLDLLSRYHTGVIEYEQSVSQLRLVGSFPLKDTRRVLSALENSLPIRITHVSPTLTKITPR